MLQQRQLLCWVVSISEPFSLFYLESHGDVHTVIYQATEKNKIYSKDKLCHVELHTMSSVFYFAAEDPNIFQTCCTKYFEAIT